MRRHLAFEDVDVAAGEEVAQMIVGAAVAQPDLEDRTIQPVDRGLQEVQAVALRLHARDETVETAHACPSGGPGRGAQLLIGVLEAMRQLPHDLHRHLRELRDQAVEHVLGDLERGKRLLCLDGGGARHVAEDGDLAHDIVALQFGDREWAFGRVHDHVGLAADDDIGAVAGLALAEQHVAVLERHPLARERQQLELGRLDVGEHRDVAEKLDFFVEAHGGNTDDLAIYGQESNPTTGRLCKMNLAIRGIDGNLGPQNADTFHNDLHKDLKADFILANPPFNISDWGGERLKDDVRWKYGVPPAGNANYGWIQHMIHHLSPTGIAGFILANGSLSSNTSGEGEIRKKLIEAGLVDCIVALPDKLFYTVPIAPCLWFVSRDRYDHKFRNRHDEILFIDARKIGSLVSSRNRELTDEDIQKISSVYHSWRTIRVNTWM